MAGQYWIQKLNQFEKLEKTHVINYTILKTLSEAIKEDQNIPFHLAYQTHLKSLPHEIKQLNLYKQLIHNIWINENYSINVRQQCCHQILTLVTQWIVKFEVKVDQVKNTSDKFKLIRQFIVKNCNQIQKSILVIDQIFQDLRDFMDQSFWNLPDQNIQTCKQYTFLVEVDPQTPLQLISLLEILIYRQVQFIAEQDNQNYQFYVSTSQRFTSSNYYFFVMKCINYLLCLNLDQSLQSQATKLALEFSRTKYCLLNQKDLIKLFERLMLRTKKAVRYALVQQYIETYKFFQILHCDHVIEKLQDMVYFRQLIFGHCAIHLQNHQFLEDNLSITVKAGSKQRVFFSVEDCKKAILKFELILSEGMDINLRMYNLSSVTKQVLYHSQQKTQLRKLVLKIDYMGLYALEFDNTYSWIQGKKILYNIHLMKQIEDISEIIYNNNQKQS